jgi:hypothetical protein
MALVACLHPSVTACPAHPRLGLSTANVVDEGKGRAGANAHGAQPNCVLWSVLSVAVGEGVGHRVKPPGLVLDCEVDPEQLVDPLMLRHGRQVLV